MWCNIHHQMTHQSHEMHLVYTISGEALGLSGHLSKKLSSCIYDMSVNGQEFELSLGHKIVTSPVDTIYFDGKTAEGKFRATMELFKNDGFKKKDSYKVKFYF